MAWTVPGCRLYRRAQQLEFVECASLLLRSSAEINDRDHRGRSAVMTACMNNDSEMVQSLLGFRAEVGCGDVDGYTSLMLACERSDAEVVGLLLWFRADANHSNLRGTMPLHIAALLGTMIFSLLFSLAEHIWFSIKILQKKPVLPGPIGFRKKLKIDRFKRATFEHLLIAYDGVCMKLLDLEFFH